MAKISKDTPLSSLTLRRYERPYELKGRELIRKLCLSLGLLQPGDSRDVIVDVLLVLLEAKKKKEKLIAAEIEKRVIDYRKANKLPLSGIAPSNIRRQILRLRELFIVEKEQNDYFIAEFESLEQLFLDKIEKYMLPSIVARVKEYLKKTDNEF